MSHLVQDLIRAHAENKSIHLGALSGADFKALMAELALVKEEVNHG
ncbi:TPA: hypothetical protein NKP23_004570 [Vibrio parahaemolyticus]|nr:hypothetical protein [Vibrio parahaemolyticus]